MTERERPSKMDCCIEPDAQEAWDVKRPRSVDKASQMFMDSSKEYLEVVPRMTKRYLPVGDSPESRATKRTSVLALAMMRKFLKNGESVYAPWIFDEIYAQRKDRIPCAKRKRVRRLPHILAALLKEIYEAEEAYDNGHLPEDSPPVSTATLVDKVLYGRVLHSDYEKWIEAGESPWFIITGSCMDAESTFRRYLECCRRCFIDLSDWGVIEGLRYETPVEDELDESGNIVSPVAQPSPLD